jgi:hypothetical protein
LPPSHPTDPGLRLPRSPMERSRALRRCAGPWLAHDLADADLAGRRRLLRVLTDLERQERARGLTRPPHWTYVPARHAGLIECLRQVQAEIAALEAAEAQMPRPPATSTVTPVT